MSVYEENDEGGYALVMPFVAVKSNGGHYDDESFAAGFECGKIDAVLAISGMRIISRWVALGWLEQLDLIAMKNGYKITVEQEGTEQEGTEGWKLIRFQRQGDSGLAGR